MTRVFIPLALAGAAFAGSTQAQTPPSFLAPGVDPHRYQADQREAFARQLQFETRLNRLEIEAARRPEPAQPLPYRARRSPEEERALRKSATGRRRSTTAGVTQIDDWLDRPAR